MSAVLAQIPPPQVELTLAPIPERPCTLKITTNHGDSYVIVRVLSPSARKTSERVLCVVVEKRDDSHLDLEYAHDRCLWIGGARFTVSDSEARKIEDLLAPLGLRVKRKAVPK